MVPAVAERKARLLAAPPSVTPPCAAFSVAPNPPPFSVPVTVTSPPVAVTVRLAPASVRFPVTATDLPDRVPDRVVLPV